MTILWDGRFPFSGYSSIYNGFSNVNSQTWVLNSKNPRIFSGDWENFMEMENTLKKSGFFGFIWAFFLHSGWPWKNIVNVHDLSDHAVCLLDDGAFGSVLADRFYKFSKRSSGMNPAACNFKIVAFFCKLVIDLVSVCDHSSGESLQEFLGMFLNDGKATSQREG